MTAVEHLLENAILSVANGEPRHIFHDEWNAAQCSITEDEAYALAQHIVNSLYEGVSPNEIGNMQRVVYCKNCIHYNKSMWTCKLTGKMLTNDGFCSSGEE